MPHTFAPSAYEQTFYSAAAFDMQAPFKQQSPLRDPTAAFPERASPIGSSFPNSSPRISESSSVSDTPLYSPAMSLSTPFDAFLEPEAVYQPTSCMASQASIPAPFHFGMPQAHLTSDGHGLILPNDPRDPNAGMPFQMGMYTSALAGYESFPTMPFAYGNGMHSMQVQQPAYGYPQPGSVSPSTSSDSPLLAGLDMSSPRHTSLPAQQIALTFPVPTASPPPKKRRTLSHSHASDVGDDDELAGRAKIHVCPVCARCFSRSHDMRRHIRGHNEGSHYKCDKCGRGFRRLDAVKRHLRTACQGQGR